MASTSSKSSLTILPLALMSLALVGFLLTAYWQQQQDYQALQRELSLARASAKEQFEKMASQAALRHNAVVKMSEDVAVLREELEVIQSAVKSQTGDIARQGLKFSGQVENIDKTNQQELRAIESIKTEIKEHTDTFLAAMLKQERELAILNAERAKAQEAAAAAASIATTATATDTSSAVKTPATPVPAPSVSPVVATAASSATATNTLAALAQLPSATTTNTTASIKSPALPTPLAPPQPITTMPSSTGRIGSLPLPPIVPDLGGAAGTSTGR
jgi:hypothetical protein